MAVLESVERALRFDDRSQIPKLRKAITQNTACFLRLDDGVIVYESIEEIIGEALANAFGHCNCSGPIIVRGPNIIRDYWCWRISNPASSTPNCQHWICHPADFSEMNHRGIQLIQCAADVLRQEGYRVCWHYKYHPREQRTYFYLAIAPLCRKAVSHWGPQRWPRGIITRLSRGRIP